MPVHNSEIADILGRLATLLEIEGANPFRVRAYQNAARTLDGLAREVVDLLAEGEDLSELPGIGKDLAAKIEEIAARAAEIAAPFAEAGVTWWLERLTPDEFGAAWSGVWPEGAMRERVRQGPPRL